MSVFTFLMEACFPKYSSARNSQIASSSSIHWNEVVCFDTETTGLGDDAEILQLSIVDGTGRILYDQRFNTRYIESWDEAAKIHGIWPSDVEDEPYFSDCTDEIEEILSKAKLIIAYNLPFDERKCQLNGLTFPSAPRLDVMVPFAKVYGEYSRYHRNYKWQKLVTAADYYGVRLPRGMSWHDSTADCIATVGVFKAMIRDGHFPDIHIS